MLRQDQKIQVREIRNITSDTLNPIRGGLLWSGVEAGGGGGADSAPPPSFIP